MRESIIINNFAGISQVVLDISDINILIGPQATGKSICAKLLYFFKIFPEVAWNALQDYLSITDLQELYLKRFEDYFPQQGWGKNDFYIRYELNDAYIEIKKKDSSRAKLELSYSDRYFKSFQSIQSIIGITRENTEESSINRIQFLKKIKDIFYEELDDSIGNIKSRQIFIPAGRSFFANLQSSIFSFLSNNNAIDPFLTEFGSFYENMKNSVKIKRMYDEPKETKYQIKRLVDRILCGHYIREKNKDYLLLKDGRKISLENSSSGQQEFLPLAVILSIISYMHFSYGCTIYIEEPEAHLFPSAQRDIVELISLVYNKSKNPRQFFITTHSPYILTSFNNLIQAGDLKRRLEGECAQKLLTIVPEEMILNPDLVRPYILHDGTADSLIDPESGLIGTSLMDKVSTEIAIQFDELLSMEEFNA